MARQPRIDLPGIAQHLVQRGNDRQPCFFRDIDRTRYLRDLRELSLKGACDVHAYVRMTNYVHLLVTPFQSGAISRLMQPLGRQYVRVRADRQAVGAPLRVTPRRQRRAPAAMLSLYRTQSTLEWCPMQVTIDGRVTTATRWAEPTRSSARTSVTAAWPAQKQNGCMPIESWYSRPAMKTPSVSATMCDINVQWETTDSEQPSKSSSVAN